MKKAKRWAPAFPYYSQYQVECWHYTSPLTQISLAKLTKESGIFLAVGKFDIILNFWSRKDNICTLRQRIKIKYLDGSSQ